MGSSFGGESHRRYDSRSFVTFVVQMFRAWTAKQDGLTRFPSGLGFLRLVDKTADIFADAICHRNVEARLGWNIEEMPARVVSTGFGTVDLDLAGA